MLKNYNSPSPLSRIKLSGLILLYKNILDQWFSTEVPKKPLGVPPNSYNQGRVPRIKMVINLFKFDGPIKS